MMYRHPKLAVSWLPLSILLSLNSIDFLPVNAQAVDRTQLPNSNPTQPLPQPQDIQPPAPVPLPPPQQPQQLPPPGELLQPSSPDINPQQQVPENAPQTITVERFEVVGSTVFSQEELAKVTTEFTKRPITLAELFQARSKITELYVNKGYITSGAYIPPQTIKSGVIKIQVVEGRLEDIQITGNRRLKPNYVRSRLAIATQPPLNRESLLEALQLLQLNPLIQNLSAELSAGSRPGTSVLQVQITEAKSFNAQLALDNGRSPGVGSFRRRVQLNEANLLGFGDNISLVYSNTDGSNTLDTSYTLPLNPRNGTISFNFGTSSSNVIEEPFNTLDIESSSRYYEITYRQPLAQSPSQEFAIGLTASRRESEISSSLFDEEPRLPPSVLSPGADDQGRTRISALRFFQEWTTRNSRQVFAVRSQFNLGIGALNATVNAEPPDSRFFSWQGQAQWARLLAPETLLIIKANTQIASKGLLSLEQFGLGGLDSVRGYRQDFLLTDNGAFASAEVQIPILRLSRSDALLQVTPFVDFGVAWNNYRETPDPNTLASVGLGLRWSSGDRFSARLDWGIPLISVDSQARTWQENGLYFSLIYNPF
ncbi:Surface antigen variable number [Trichormus variabilis ATCC 29413]|uniref:Surface antigen variable number n=2 Tax=Anabaena variabilis TaxID=264691 RepID=Q3M4R2_TRIV2|nr:MULTISPECIES: ShlB/FhaC/HecB family hemolysin secretion/activation protein [Nostocaceae]ABA24024.1 Surface antigen variable number [Trichormus variabilis ATCC 29413]MBC1216392.1 ShlB/FhaC/HecB family hemolysin secretion/activation protein [Trichormus variabilis ARAD]MBC1258564.1 ShlB/FhaC/HecB family hemolysin secretion/activation protein [Trichormus variabilis V5]MBC1267363.1 ShlB/FhaC/HecB family hemolysin secretion/activation protein [Trichormus variabilis FSR]MBC1300699.1 ShlB/FhaC/HecB